MFGERLAVIRIRQLVYARFPDGPAGGGEAFRNQPGAEVLSRRDCPNTRQLPLMRGTRRDARAIEDLLTRPRGRPSHTPLVRYRSFQYRTASWDRPRRVIAKIEHHLGELFPRVGFIVTTLTGTNRAVVRFYNQRGTAEQWIKEGKEAAHSTRLSCHRFRANEVRLLLGVIAYNLGNLLRRLVLPSPIESWSLTSLQQRPFKTRGRLIRHARYFILQLAESSLTRTLFRQILGRINRLTGIRPDGEDIHRARARSLGISGGVSERDGRGKQTPKHGVAHGPCVARMTSGKDERAERQGDPPFNATADGRNGSVLENPVN